MNSEIRNAYNRCKPEEALQPDDDRYVDFSAKGLRGKDGDLVNRLRNNIRLSDSHPRLLVSGFRGSGKTTELRRLAKRLPEDGYRTIYIDSDAYLNLRVPASVADLWVCIAGAVDHYLAENFPTRTKIKRLTERLNAFLQRELEIKDITLGGDTSPTPGTSVGGSVTLDLKENHTFRTRLNDELKNRAKLPSFVDECRNFAEEAIATIRKEDDDAEGVVLIVDSFEKLQGDHTNAEAVRGSAENIFSRDWSLLETPCHAVFTVPPWLPFLDIGPDAGVHMLPMCKLFEKDEGGSAGALDDEGCAALFELLEKRINLDRVFGADNRNLLRPLVEACGGYPRDLLRLMRELLGREADAETLPLDAESVKSGVAEAITGLREQYALALDAEDIEVLRHVAEQKSVIGLRRDEKLRVAELFEHHFVLSYRNGERWFDLHPLVREIDEISETFGPRH